MNHPVIIDTQSIDAVSCGNQPNDLIPYIDYETLCSVIDSVALDAVNFLRQVINGNDDIADKLSAARIILTAAGDYIVNRKKVITTQPFINDID